jgi:hypothetical protein
MGLLLATRGSIAYKCPKNIDYFFGKLKVIADKVKIDM